MIKDLDAQRPDTRVKSGVLIIGAGIAGLILGYKLRQMGMRVVTLESGGRAQAEETHPLNAVVTVRSEYKGASHGRARCLGGTSTRWGGALLPFLPEDLEPRPHLKLPGWPLSLTELEPYIPELELLFALDKGSYDEAFADSRRELAQLTTKPKDFLLRFAKWPTFKKRNLANLFKQRIEADPDWLVFLNAAASEFVVDVETGRLRTVHARVPGGSALTAEADNVVICAGAIESTRLLLLMDRQHGGRIFEDCPALGCYFHDHVSAKAADITTATPRQLNRLAGFRFVGSTMRSLRFEIAPTAQQELGIGSAFGHISFQSIGHTGFDELRTFMRTLQQSGRVNARAGLSALRDGPYLAKTAYWRFFHNQLRWPDAARYEFHIVAEQLPRVSNKIYLSDQTDQNGVAIPAIDWRVDTSDYSTIRAFATAFDSYWRDHGLKHAGQFDWLPWLQDGGDAVTANVEDVYHPGGTTRMGPDARSAVVDSRLRVFAVPNLWVASTSTFPSGASANPTMMLALLVLRLADELARTANSEASMSLS